MLPFLASEVSYGYITNQILFFGLICHSLIKRKSTQNLKIKQMSREDIFNTNYIGYLWQNFNYNAESTY